MKFWIDSSCDIEGFEIFITYHLFKEEKGSDVGFNEGKLDDFRLLSNRFAQQLFYGV